MGSGAKHSSVAVKETDKESPLAVEPYQSSSYHRHRSITEEMKRLMQEQDNLSEVSPFASDIGRKSQVRPQADSQTSNVIINMA